MSRHLVAGFAVSQRHRLRHGAPLGLGNENIPPRTCDTTRSAHRGFVCTGSDLSPADFVPPQAAGDRRHFPLETTASGVFAIGDARANSTKRLAAAVGEGAAVVAQVHAWLASHEQLPK